MYKQVYESRWRYKTLLGLYLKFQCRPGLVFVVNTIIENQNSPCMFYSLIYSAQFMLTKSAIINTWL